VAIDQQRQFLRREKQESAFGLYALRSVTNTFSPAFSSCACAGTAKAKVSATDAANAQSPFI
jgi:hypothetical protein